MFDFDGVLINTIQFWFRLHKSANETLTWEQFSDMSNGNFIVKQNELHKEGKYNWPTDYEQSYDEALEKEFTIEDILHDTVLDLADEYHLSIVSSASNKVITKFLQKQNLEGCFHEILGYEDHHSKVVKIKSLLEKYSINSKDAVLITDTLGDVSEANDASVKSIGVTWGLHKEDTLRQGNPTKIIDNPLDLVIAIENVLK